MIFILQQFQTFQLPQQHQLQQESDRQCNYKIIERKINHYSSHFTNFTEAATSKDRTQSMLQQLKKTLLDWHLKIKDLFQLNQNQMLKLVSH